MASTSCLNNVAQVPLATDLDLLRTVNVDGTRLLLDASIDAGVGKVIHTSSSAVFGVPDTNPVLPSTVPAPMEAYGLRQARRRMGVPRRCPSGARRLDRAAAHDPRPRPPRHLRHPVRLDRRRADPIVLGDGTNRYQFVHSDDLADVCLLAAEHTGPGPVQRRHRPVRHDARDARGAVSPRRHRERSSARFPPAPPASRCTSAPRSGSRRSPRTTG